MAEFHRCDRCQEELVVKNDAQKTLDGVVNKGYFEAPGIKKRLHVVVVDTSDTSSSASADKNYGKGDLCSSCIADIILGRPLVRAG